MITFCIEPPVKLNRNPTSTSEEETYGQTDGQSDTTSRLLTAKWSRNSVWNPEVSYIILKSPLLGSIHIKLNPFHIFTAYYFKIHFNIIQP